MKISCWVFVLLIAAQKETSADILLRTPFGANAVEFSRLVDAVKQTANTSVTVVSSKPPLRGDKTPPAELKERFKGAEAAYRNLALDRAIENLSGVEAECIRTASYEGCREFLFETAVLRGMVYLALKRTRESDLEFQSAHIASPSSVLNPKKYAPNVLNAFAAACTEFENDAHAEIALRPSPKTAAFFADGIPLEKDTVRLSSGRHVLEARLIGFETERIFVTVDADGNGAPAEAAPTLRPSDDVTAWSALVAALSQDTVSLADPGIHALLLRFHIDAVMTVDMGVTPAGAHETWTVRIARAGKRDILELPSVLKSEPIPVGFDESLRIALGLVPSPKSALPQGPLVPSAESVVSVGSDLESDDDDGDSSIDDEDEDPSLQFEASEEAPNPSPEKKNIFKSPWLWISVGVVVAIVSGGVIAVKVHD